MEIGVTERSVNNFEVTDSGIVYHKYWVNTPVEELVIPKEIFIEAFEKYIVPLIGPKEIDCRVDANGIPIIPLVHEGGTVCCDVKVSGTKDGKL